jgi:toxin-antitoxin system PIN domain toxin
MIAIDTNILVHAHRRDSSFHGRAKEVITGLAEAPRPWAIPLHCFVEFYGIVTHAAIWKTPSTLEQVRDQIESWRESPTLTTLGDEGETLDRTLALALAGRVVGAKIHDARIAALCLSHGVTELWTVDRDFSRFPQLRTANPLMR